MELKNLLPGDVLWGSFPVDDGRRRALHPALIVGAVARIPIALTGTSQDVPDRCGPQRLVLAPRGKPSLDHFWQLTGLVKSTRFDGNGRAFPLVTGYSWIQIGTIRPYRQESRRHEWDRAFHEVSVAAMRSLMLRMARERNFR